MPERAPFKEMRIADRGGRHHHPLRTAVQQGCHGLLAAHAPRDLQLDAGPLEHARNHRSVAGRAASGVQVDDVQALCSRGGESLRHLHGVVGVDGRAVVFALGQADAAPTEDVDGRDYVHPEVSVSGSS